MDFLYFQLPRDGPVGRGVQVGPPEDPFSRSPPVILLHLRWLRLERLWNTSGKTWTRTWVRDQKNNKKQRYWMLLLNSIYRKSFIYCRQQMYFQWLAFVKPFKPNLVKNIKTTLQVRLEQLLPQWSTWAEKQQKRMLHAFSRVFTEKLIYLYYFFKKKL